MSPLAEITHNEQADHEMSSHNENISAELPYIPFP